MGLSILICDDEFGTQKTLKMLFGGDNDVFVANNGVEGLEVLAKHAVDIVITDNMMPELTGLELIQKAKPLYPQTSFILMTAFGNLDQAVQAIKSGAEDYILKPFELADIEHRVARIKKFKTYERKNLAIEEVTGIDRLIGGSGKVRQMKDFTLQVAAAPTSVLLLGPSGSGKEVMAKAIHESSPRKDQAFVSVNCACLSENLLESELFGHEKGSFTGATQAKAGKFELAQGGTIFLDEIGELPLVLQAKLLRVLQEKEFYRVGGTRLLKTDARVIAATNRSLKDMVAAGTFREDLYFRINVISFDLEPLSERREDIPALVDHFSESLSVRFNKIIYLREDLRKALHEYSYPGNVRELQNIIERLMVLTPHKNEALLSTLPFAQSTADSDRAKRESIFAQELGRQSLVDILESLEKSLVEEAMARNGHNQVKAADMLQITRGALQYKLKKYGLLSNAA